MIKNYLKLKILIKRKIIELIDEMRRIPTFKNISVLIHEIDIL